MAHLYIDDNFEKKFIQPLSDFVRIPNTSPTWDPEYLTNGLVDRAMQFVTDFADSLNIPQLKHGIYREPNVSPMLCIVVEGTIKANVMFYGHVDKQPHMTERWSPGLGPVDPVIKDGKLYGRGSGDDGYAPFACLLAIKARLTEGCDLPRIVIVLETEEESGSPNLIYLLEKMEHMILEPDICICLDSGCCDYNTLWLTSSLRGLAAVNLKVQITNEGNHSGDAGGIVPETFSILRQLLDRLDNSKDCRVIDVFQEPIPPQKEKEARYLADLKGSELYEEKGFVENAHPIYHNNLPELYLNGVWRASLHVTGANGLPEVGAAGNVLRPSTELRLSLRLPPTKDPKIALNNLQKILTDDPPHGAKIILSGGCSGNGWLAPQYPQWMVDSLNKASTKFYGQPTQSFGVGGSIPFLFALGEKFPKTKILALGVTGPGSKAHCPDESLNLPYVKKFIHILADFLSDTAEAYSTPRSKL